MQDLYLVEDSAIVRQRLETLLTDLPETRIVGHAGGAREAVRDILAKRPDVVLCDLNLTQGTGFDVLRAVHQRAPGIDLYMLSNFSAEPYRRMAARLGARDFFDKSRDIQRVREVLAARAALAPH